MSTEEKNMIEILDENIPIDITKYISYVEAPHCGAIATFAGTTTGDNFEGKTLLELSYDACVPMAVRCINTICSSARSSWNLNAIAVAHRLGPVGVGETSVFIAVSSAHRADALDACKFLSDKVKGSGITKKKSRVFELVLSAAAVYGTYEAIRYKVPGLLKVRYIGQTTLGSAAVFGLFLGAGSLIHCGKSY
ncbi:hypothetical protein ACS0TY_005339 [Phlomoides rotata]